MHATAEPVPDFSKILFQKDRPLPGSIRFFDMETPRPVTAGFCGVSTVEPGKLSLPSFLYGNPWFRVTPSFFRLWPLFIRHPNTPTPPKGGNPSKRRDASPLPIPRP